MKLKMRQAFGWVVGGFFVASWISSCDNRLVNLTAYLDPCGTILANCTPGSFITNRADVGDYCIDPTCTVPGQCGTGQALGTITDLCP